MYVPLRSGAVRMGRKGKAGGRVDPDVMARQQRCLDAIVAGESYTSIALREGYASESGARAAVEAVIQRAAIQGAEELRPVLAARATDMWRRGHQVMVEGQDAGDMDMFRVGAVVADRALARTMRLFGLDQATTTVQMGGSPGDLEALKQLFAQQLDGGVIDGEIVEDGS